MDTGVNELHGFVVDENGQPVAARAVVLNWRQSGGGVEASTTRRAAADVQGTFAFRQIGPGAHTVMVLAEGYELASVEHDVASQGYQVVVRMQRPKSAG